MKFKKSLGSLTTTCVVLLIMMTTTTTQVDGLSEYCSTINQKELYEKLKTCYTPTDSSSSSSTVPSPPASTTSYTVASGGNRVTGQSTASLPSYFQTQLSQVNEFHFYIGSLSSENKRLKFKKFDFLK